MSNTDSNIVYIAGTDTNVGKTTVAVELLRQMTSRGVVARPLKPFCSGGREDASALRDAVQGRWSLEEINPHYYRTPVTPLLAAEIEGQKVFLDECVSLIEGAARECEILVVEGAGGILSPLGIGFDLLRLIRETGGRTVLVAANRIGAINQVLMAAGIMAFASTPPDAVVLSGVTTEEAFVRDGNVDILRQLRPKLLLDQLPDMRSDPGGTGTNQGKRFLSKTLAVLLRGNYAPPPFSERN